MNCIACGGVNLIEGNILNSDGGKLAVFKPLEVSMWKAVFGIDVREITALACVHCGNLHLNVNFSDEDKNRYRQFDGQQPDLLKRIESE